MPYPDWGEGAQLFCSSPPTTRWEALCFARLLGDRYRSVGENAPIIHAEIRGDGLSIAAAKKRTFFNFYTQSFTHEHGANELPCVATVPNAEVLMESLVASLTSTIPWNEVDGQEFRINSLQEAILKYMRSKQPIRHTPVQEIMEAVKDFPDVSSTGMTIFFNRLVNRQDVLQVLLPNKNAQGQEYKLAPYFYGCDFSAYVQPYDDDDFQYLTEKGKLEYVYSKAHNAETPEQAWAALTLLQKLTPEQAARFCKKGPGKLFILLSGAEAEYARLFLAGLPACKSLSETMFFHLDIQQLQSLYDEGDIYAVIDEMRNMPKGSVVAFLDGDNGRNFINNLTEDEAHALNDVLEEFPGGKALANHYGLPALIRELILQ